MTYSRAKYACLVVLLTGLAVWGLEAKAADGKLLRWNFTAGQTTKYVMEQTQEQQTSVAGQMFTSTTTTISDVTWHVDAVDGDGTATMTQTFDRLRMSIKGFPGAELEYDSMVEKKPEGFLATLVVPILEAISGKSIIVTVNTRGIVSNVEIPKELTDALKNNQALGPIGEMFSEDAIKQMTGASALQFPEESVEVGNAWDFKAVIKNQVGTQTTTTSIEYQGQEEVEGIAYEKLAVKVNQSIDAAADAQVKIEIKEQTSDGKILFDGARGQLHDSQMTSTMKMALTSMGMNIDQTVTSNGTMKLAGGDEVAADAPKPEQAPKATPKKPKKKGKPKGNT